jgi:hypothetical protein
MRTPILNSAAPTTMGVSFPSRSTPTATATVVTVPHTSSPAFAAQSTTVDGVTYDTSLGECTVIISKTAREQEELDNRVLTEHRATPILQGDTALETIDSQLGKISKSIRRERPDLANASWDFTVKDGKLAVVAGGMSKQDKAWLEDKLNSSDALTAAVSTFMKASEDYLETSEDNPAYQGVNYATHKAQSYEFHDIKGKLEGQLNFKELISAVKEMYVTPNGSRITGYHAGYAALEIIASRLS